MAYAEDARRLLDELKGAGIETPCDAAAELALSAQVDRLPRGALEFQAQIRAECPRPPAGNLVMTADRRYRQALPEALFPGRPLTHRSATRARRRDAGASWRRDAAAGPPAGERVRLRPRVWSRGFGVSRPGRGGMTPR